MRLRWWVFLSMILSGLSFFLWYYVLTNYWPVPHTVIARPQMLFFTFMFLGLTTGTIPFTAYMNHRFAKPDWRQRDRIRLLRQGAWVGLLGILLAYLQLLRALNWAIALVLMAVLIIIEAFLLTRD